jgi:hypothetical protein
MSAEESTQGNREAVNESGQPTQLGVTGDSPSRGGLDSAAGSLMSRRALIRAGWTLPAILAVKLPSDAFADYAHGDAWHADGGSTHIDHNVHLDTGHGDLHADRRIGGLHLDSHFDTSHVDSNVHGDVSS